MLLSERKRPSPDWQNPKGVYLVIAVGRVVGRLHSVGTQTKLNMRADTSFAQQPAHRTRAASVSAPRQQGKLRLEKGEEEYTWLNSGDTSSPAYSTPSQH